MKHDIEYYDLIRIDRSGRGGGVACYVRKSSSYNHESRFCPNIESILWTFLAQSKPTLVGVLLAT